MKYRASSLFTARKRHSFEAGRWIRACTSGISHICNTLEPTDKVVLNGRHREVGWSWLAIFSCLSQHTKTNPPRRASDSASSLRGSRGCSKCGKGFDAWPFSHRIVHSVSPTPYSKPTLLRQQAHLTREVNWFWRLIALSKDPGSSLGPSLFWFRCRYCPQPKPGDLGRYGALSTG